MKKNIKILLIIFLSLIILLFNNCINVQAAFEDAGGGSSTTTQSGTPTTIDPDEWKPDNLQMHDYDEVVDVAVIIIAVIRYIGVAVSIIVLLIIGIKYMTGTVQEKAEYKKTMIPYLIGVFIFFTLSQILPLIIGLIADFE